MESITKYIASVISSSVIALALSTCLAAEESQAASLLESPFAWTKVGKASTQIQVLGEHEGFILGIDYSNDGLVISEGDLQEMRWEESGGQLSGDSYLSTAFDDGFLLVDSQTGQSHRLTGNPPTLHAGSVAPASSPALALTYMDGVAYLLAKGRQENEVVLYANASFMEENPQAWEEKVRLSQLEPSKPILLTSQFDGRRDALYFAAQIAESPVPEWGLQKFDLHTSQVSFLYREGGALPSFLIPTGVAHLVVGPSEGSESAGTRAFQTITQAWAKMDVSDFPAAPSNIRATSTNARILKALDSETDEVSIFRWELTKPPASLHWVDAIALLLYAVGIIWMGYFFSKREKSTEDFFLGGKRIPGWVSGISIIATNISAMSLLSLPALAFGTNWTIWPLLLTPLLAAPLVIILVLPFFHGKGFRTPYQFLEQRFDASMRILGSLSYLLYEILRTGALIVLPSLVLSVVTGIDITICILGIGVVATVYTVMGGFEAVVWTDFAQTLIMVGGIFATVGIIIFRVGDETVPLLTSAIADGKTQLFVWSWDLSTITISVFILNLSSLLNGYVSHQPTVQRFISTKDLGQAHKALWSAGLAGPGVLISFFITGLGLYIFYSHFPERMSASIAAPDQFFAWFIIAELPVGLTGLLIGGIFAATMSSLDSGISSVSTVLVTDYFQRFRPERSERQWLRLAKLIAIFTGIMGTGFAIWIAQMDIKYIFDAFLEFTGLLTGGVAGIFLLGMFSKRAHTRGVWVGFICSCLAVYLVKDSGAFHYFLYGGTGTITCLVVGYLASVVLPRKAS